MIVIVTNHLKVKLTNQVEILRKNATRIEEFSSDDRKKLENDLQTFITTRLPKSSINVLKTKYDESYWFNELLLFGCGE